ncbi:AAA family ATPase [Colwellia asteriadis]|uniref:AAA family ATPase n=1 Tax=Colwellia asteriadis TaxID=517723 RepID=A0ABN1L2F2_9GAMM
MNLSNSTIKKIISSDENIVVAQVINDDESLSSNTAILKYQNTDYPSIALDACWKNEYNILQSISSDWVVKAYGLVKHKNSNALLLEDFSSETLASLIEKNQLTFTQRLHIACQLASALGDIHRHKLIHRDITPANILVDIDSFKIKLCDFSKAIRLSYRQVPLNHNNVHGDFAYLSPEQTGRTNLKVDYRSDFYSLGITLYHLFSGKVPFKSDNVMTLLHCHIARIAEPLSEVDQTIPEVLSAIVAKLMAKSPENRYQSARGLQVDLHQCYQQWQKNDMIELFTLAQSDISLHFHISPKLYGRDKELSIILEGYQRSCIKRAELAMVSGYSGIGKSALVHELQKSIIANEGVFISGKCDQYNSGQPFFVLIDALQQFLQKILSESKESQFNWRNKLQLVLGDNAAIITELLPSLELIIGSAPPLIQLPPAEAELRLNMVFTDFVGALYSSEQPLVIFLDDLQWVDMPTLKLLQQEVTDSNPTGLYVVGAYRDNEVDESHPLMTALSNMSKNDALIQVSLTPLKLQHIQRLLTDTLHCSLSDAKTLARICLDKTQGNPFFLNQFLLALYQEGDISYQHQHGKWWWDIEQIQQRDMTDNVVELMIMRLQQLDNKSQLLASIAAHLGHRFSFKQLLSACQYNTNNTAKILWPLLEAGFIIPLDEHYQHIDDESSLIKSQYRFLHDRVQQAAYLLTPEAGRDELLLHIGRHWLADSTEDEIETNLFTLLNLLNGSVALIDDVDELRQLATLNYRAGLKSKGAATYASAVAYLRKATELLPVNSWQYEAEQTFSIYKALIDVEFLAGNVAAAKTLYEQTIVHVSTQEEKIALILLRTEQCQSMGEFQDAISLLVGGLAILKIDFPENEDVAQAQLKDTFIATQELLAQCSEQDILTAEKMTNKQHLLRMELHNAMTMATYLSGRTRSYAVNACQMVILSLKYGQCQLSSIGYASYATVMSMMGEVYPACYQMSKLAKSVSDLWESKYHRSMIYGYFSSSYLHWCEAIENSYPFLEQVISWGQEGINFVYSGYSVLFKSCNKFIAGVPLNELQEDIEQGLAFLRKKQQPATENYVLVGTYQALLALQGKTHSINSFDSDDFNVTQFFGDKANTPSMDLAFYTGAIIRHAFIIDDKALQNKALENIDIVGMFLPDSPSMVEGLFYQALILLNHDDAEVLLDKAKEITERFKVWSVDSPKNYLHKHLLLSAEVARVEGLAVIAMDFYAQAINAANEAGFINNEALASECYAKYLFSLGQKRLALSCMKDAFYLYSRWGALAKCQQINERWPEQSFDSANIVNLPKGSAISTNASKAVEQMNSLDLHSLLKANQLLSEEIHVNSLLEKMMTVLMENAGAQQGAIIVYGDGQLTVEIVGRISDHAAAIHSQFYNMNLDELEAQGNPLLPDTLIRYTQKTLETLILDNPKEDSRFSSNRYLQLNQPKSLMCLPITGQGRLVAIVYLENNVTEQAFTAKHKDTVELIAAQAAVSLINARHYEILEDKVAQRTEELQLLAIKDGLTGIFNRREFDLRLEQEWSRSSREGGSLSLIMIDIDYFKAYNDNYGHPEGDKCIKLVAQALSEVVTRKNDLVARYGGEEFVILMTNTDHESIENIARRCQDKIRSLNILHAFSTTAPYITISMGISTMTSLPGLEPSMLVKSADVALYKAKQSGRNSYYFASPS